MSENKLYFTEDHEWVKVEGDIGYIGITDYAQGELGDLIFVELPSVDDNFNKKDVFGTIEAVKTVADLYMPVTSIILDINPKIEDKPELINSSPLDDGWIVKVKIQNLSELENLLNNNQYNNLIK